MAQFRQRTQLSHAIVESLCAVVSKAAPGTQPATRHIVGNPCILHLLHWQAGSVPLGPPGKPKYVKSGGELTKNHMLERNLCLSFVGFYNTDIERDISCVGCL